jgi:hypothetical protein
MSTSNSVMNSKMEHMECTLERKSVEEESSVLTLEEGTLAGTCLNMKAPEELQSVEKSLTPERNPYIRLDPETEQNISNPSLEINVNIDPKALEEMEEYYSALEKSGILAAYENALFLVSKKGPGPAELRDFIAKEIENFGRRWKSGVVDKNRYSSSQATQKIQKGIRADMYYDIEYQKAKEVAEKKRLEEERRAEQEAARIKRENDIRMQRIKAESEERRLVEERQRLSELQRAREEEERKLAERLEQDAIRKKEEKEITKEEVSSCIEYLIETICEVESVLAQIIDDTINAESIEIGNGSEKVMAIEEEIKLQQVQKMTNDNE